ncbi:MAG: class I SAM-dependent methyltransferase [Candidatus Fermentibacteria bacterium]
MKRYFEAEEGNRVHWDELAGVHAESYDYRELVRGGHVMDHIQTGEVGEVRNSSLLHLQCHIGTDTLSWARLGAYVTGVDISPLSLRVAQRLAKKAGLNARFIESSVYDLPDRLDETFDIVYTSIGVLCWLSDLKSWAEIIRRYLKPGGFFYMMESHPFLWVFDNESDGLVVRDPYFHGEAPCKWPADYPDYSDSDYIVKSPSWEWQWTMGEILNALIESGLKIDFLHEHSVIPWKALPSMIKGDNGFWRLPEEMDKLPLMFSLKAH